MVALANCTLSGNAAPAHNGDPSGNGGSGGGIYNNGGAMTLTQAIAYGLEESPPA